MWSTSCLTCWTSESIHRNNIAVLMREKYLVEFTKSLFLCFRSSIHTVQPIELNFSDSPSDGSAGNTIQISMDCITMHEPEEAFTVSCACVHHLRKHDLRDLGAWVQQAVPTSITSNWRCDYRHLIQILCVISRAVLKLWPLTQNFLLKF